MGSQERALAALERAATLDDADDYEIDLRLAALREDLETARSGQPSE